MASVKVYSIRSWAVIYVGELPRAVSPKSTVNALCNFLRGRTWIGPMEQGINDRNASAILKSVLERGASARVLAAAVVKRCGTGGVVYFYQIILEGNPQKCVLPSLNRRCWIVKANWIILATPGTRNALEKRRSRC